MDVLTDPQEIFDTVARHLFTQGERSFNNILSKLCAYRGKNGMKCAIGCLIPDGRYELSIEGKTVYRLSENKFPEWGPIREFLGELQIAHDQCENWYNTKTMRKELRRISDKFRLNADILDTLSFEDR